MRIGSILTATTAAIHRSLGLGRSRAGCRWFGLILLAALGAAPVARAGLVVLNETNKSAWDDPFAVITPGFLYLKGFEVAGIAESDLVIFSMNGALGAGAHARLFSDSDTDAKAADVGFTASTAQPAGSNIAFRTEPVGVNHGDDVTVHYIPDTGGPGSGTDALGAAMTYDVTSDCSDCACSGTCPVVPEPSLLILLVSGLIPLGVWNARRGHRADGPGL